MEEKPTEQPKNEIVVYQPDETIRLDVRLENDTVWLTQEQMCRLFGRTQPVIARHIGNIFKEGELDREVVYAKNAYTTRHGAMAGKTQVKEVGLYNLDVVISVGYRVKSVQGTRFRQWAAKVLKEYMLRGYAFHERMGLLEDKVDRRLAKTEADVAVLQKKVDFFVRTSLPPVQGIFFEGDFFDADAFISKHILSATKSILLIDNWVDIGTLEKLSRKASGVTLYFQKPRNTPSAPPPVLPRAKDTASDQGGWVFDYGDEVVATSSSGEFPCGDRHSLHSFLSGTGTRSNGDRDLFLPPLAGGVRLPHDPPTFWCQAPFPLW